MDFSFGFLVVLILIIFPGLIYRRFYFYGEFSKEFKSRYNLAGILAVSIIPGLINLIAVFYFYDSFFEEIDIGEVIDKFKDINSNNFRFKKSSDQPIKDLFNSQAVPFLSLLYLTTFILGVISGRFVRKTKLDTKIKFLRFKNYWFYLLNGEHTNFKKMKSLKQKNKKFVLTVADILIDTNSNLQQYSGVVVDYELQEDKCDTLSKIILSEATLINRDNENSNQNTNGLFVVDCATIKHLKLSHVYQEVKPFSFIESKYPEYMYKTFGFLVILVIPFFIFKIDSLLDNQYYNYYLNLHWFKKILAYLLFVQFLNLSLPFKDEENKREYVWSKWQEHLAKIIWIFLLILFIWL